MRQFSNKQWETESQPDQIKYIYSNLIDSHDKSHPCTQLCAVHVFGLNENLKIDFVRSHSTLNYFSHSKDFFLYVWCWTHFFFSILSLCSYWCSVKHMKTNTLKITYVVARTHVFACFLNLKRKKVWNRRLTEKEKMCKSAIYTSEQYHYTDRVELLRRFICWLR